MAPKNVFSRFIPSSSQPTGTVPQGFIQTDEGLRFDIKEDPIVGQEFPLQDVQAQLNSIFQSIGEAYDDLIQRGRTQDASRLRSATDRFRRTGLKAGINSLARSRNLEQFRSDMEVASRGVESGIIRDKLLAMSRLPIQSAALSKQAFDQAMTRADFRERKIASLPREQAERRISPARVATTRRGRPGGGRSPIGSALFRRQVMLGQDRMARGMERAGKMWPLREMFAAEDRAGIPIGATTRPHIPADVRAGVAFFGGGQTGAAGASLLPMTGGVEAPGQPGAAAVAPSQTFGGPTAGGTPLRTGAIPAPRPAGAFLSGTTGAGNPLVELMRRGRTVGRIHSGPRGTTPMNFRSF